MNSAPVPSWEPRLSRLTLGVLLVAFACLLIAQLAVARYLYGDGFREAEQRDLLARARHAQAVLRQGFAQLTPAAEDYGDWDQTNNFVAGVRPDYPTYNWLPSNLRRFQADVVFIVDPNGSMLFQRGLDATRQTVIVPSGAEASLVLAGGAVWKRRDASGAREGYAAVAGVGYQWAVAPVRETGGRGVPHGWLMLLRRLDTVFVADLERTLQSQVAFEVVAGHGTQLAAATVPLRPDELRTDAPAVDKVSATFRVGTLDNGSALQLRLSTPRYLMTRVATISTYFFWASLALGGAIAAIAMLWVRQRLLAPLAQVSERLRTIGDELDLSARLPLLGHEDEITGVAIAANRLLARVASIHDVEQARDAAVAANRAKSEFLARMSHEIRTPMNGVLGMTELLRATRLDARQQKYADTIRYSAESLLAIINDILDFSKIEAGKMTLDEAPFDLEQLVEEAAELLAEAAHSKGLELTCRVPQGLHTAYRGDALRLRQVLVNLLGNAVKFTSHGEIDLRVAELDGAQPGRKALRFEVRDTGIGIQPASLAAIFDSFSQADGSTTRRYGGTGLGLAISKQLVQLMGGQIDVRSTPGEGSTFGFSVTLQQEKQCDSGHQPESLDGRQVLIVDDNPTNREILREQLQAVGVRVWEAHNGAQALAVLRSQANEGVAFDLAILDYQMPGMDGLEVVRAVRADPALRDLRVMLLSSMTYIDEDTDWRAQRVDACLTKPVRRKDLQAVLRRVLAEPQSETMVIRKLQLSATASEAPLGLTVLLIEDNPVNQLVASSMLELLGCEVTVASDGLEGASIFEAGRFDVVLMDCQMPKLDGYGATARIRAVERQAGRSRTPVVALTANALEGDRVKCLQAGMDEFLTKPFTQGQLRQVLGASMAAAAANDPRQPIQSATLR